MGTKLSTLFGRRRVVIPFPDGVEVLHDCADAEVDICFVHGLTGNRDNTWTAYGQPEPWPKTLLPPKLDKARILTYGYDAYVVKWPVTSENKLRDHAQNLLADLTGNRASSNADSRPLIFVAHSLGGLVCKQAMLLSRNNPENHLKGIFEYTKGIVFMGTPHQGSWIADWAIIPATALGVIKSTNETLIDVLRTSNSTLKDLQNDFSYMIKERETTGPAINIRCFFEQLPNFAFTKIVSKESATYGSFNPRSINANHSNMVKFGSANDNGFVKVLDELTRWQSEIRDSAVSQPRRETQEAQFEESEAQESRLKKSTNESFSHSGTGDQFNAPRGTQNINTGGGTQLSAPNFSAPVKFGSND